MPRLRSREPRGPALLRPVRGPDRVRLPELRRPEPTRRSLLRRRAAARWSLTPGSLPPAATAAATVPERRLVSVLFADLVGFADDERARRSRGGQRAPRSNYFERCRTLIEGASAAPSSSSSATPSWPCGAHPWRVRTTPSAAVRAALALTRAVAALGVEAGMPDLRVRARRPDRVVRRSRSGTEGPGDDAGRHRQHGLAAADRSQSRAPCWSTTSRAARPRRRSPTRTPARTRSRAASSRCKTWRALRVVASVGGARRRVGLEAPSSVASASWSGSSTASEAGTRAGHAGRGGRGGGARGSRGCCGSSSSTSTA